jgi:TolB-like protein/tRNA A-37 threonylcarbamoyl transferase component Bud32
MIPDPLARLKSALAAHYAIDREIGSGGMATVYLARDLKHDREVALKVLRPELAATLGPDRFPREIRILAKLQHPHVLPLHDSGESAGFLYYVMPYVEGESLRQRLAREGQLPVHDAVRILREVADALAYAHAHGVMHRDIKPDNVMVSGRHALVTDFGVAKAVSDAGGEKLTTVGVAVGTPTYMSPEQATGESRIDARSDIYALGVLGYELLTGNPPFVGPNAQAVLSAQVLERPVPVVERRPTVPPALSDLLMRCLEKDPADRWQSAEEVLQALEAMGTPSGGVTPTHTRPTPGAKARRVRSRRAWIAGAAVLLLAAGGGTGALLFGGHGGGRIERVGVLPIKDYSGKDSVFVRALQDAVGTGIAQLGTVGVASAGEVTRVATGAVPDAEVAKRLKLDALVIASVFRAGNVMRITVQFSDPVTTRSLWSDTYERDVSDVLAAQGDIVHRIVEGVAGALGRPASVATNTGATP